MTILQDYICPKLKDARCPQKVNAEPAWKN